MTTIATDGRLMAADGRTTASGDILTESAKKLSRLPDGSVVGLSGDADTGSQAVTALARAIEDGTEPPLFKGDYILLRLLPNGKALYYYEKLVPVEISTPAAIGSGGAFAIGAMLAGVPPVDAVRIAKRRDTGTGGRIRTLEPRP